ncbi:9637_t:CDS:1, partial [Entrophospora sp. SA101]
MEGQQPDQFTVLMTAIQQLATSQQNLVNALETGGNTPSTNNPKISVKIPSYKGEPKENI